jgi:hypothetical protein
VQNQLFIEKWVEKIIFIKKCSGAPHLERAGDGGHGAGNQHDGNHAQDRGTEQAGKGRGELFIALHIRSYRVFRLITPGLIM